MKKLWILCMMSAVLIACAPGDDDYPVFVLGPIQEVEPPASYRVDSISEFTIRYSRPNTCHLFNGFYYVPNGLTRTVAVEYAKMDRTDCEVEQNPVYEVPLRFKPRNSGTYLFRFWDGQNSDGSNHYLEIEAIVPE